MVASCIGGVRNGIEYNGFADPNVARDWEEMHLLLLYKYCTYIHIIYTQSTLE